MQREKKFAVIETLIVAFALIIGNRAATQTLNVLHSFPGNNGGCTPYGSLVLSGNMAYGTASLGPTIDGEIFSVNLNNTNYTVLHNFSGSDGSNPYAGLTLCGNTLYGTTTTGGTNGGGGTVFSINTDGTGFTVLYNFSGGNDGDKPYGNLILSGNTLYGTTREGGSNYDGTVFALTTNGANFTVLYNFTGSSNGAAPYGGLVLSGNTLYGTAEGGGTNMSGTIFALNTNGAGFTVLHTFAKASTGQLITNSDGANPYDGLVLSGNTLYGTTYEGGTNGAGVVFGVNTNGSGFTILHTFPKAELGSNWTNSDGANPYGSLALSGSTLYGAAFFGGTNGTGTLFALNTANTNFTVLQTFTATAYDGSTVENTNDSANPYAGLIISSNTLYGTATAGGSFNEGTVFSLALPPPPSLAIALSNNQAILGWPTNLITYSLQSSTNLGPEAVWNAVTSPPVLINGQYTVTNAVGPAQQFFRLSQ